MKFIYCHHPVSPCYIHPFRKDRESWKRLEEKFSHFARVGKF
jgi:hypothetical protein